MKRRTVSANIVAIAAITLVACTPRHDNTGTAVDPAPDAVGQQDPSVPEREPKVTSADRYCELIRQFSGSSSPLRDVVPADADSPEAARTRHERLRTGLTDLALAAPADVRPSVETFSRDVLAIGSFYDRFDFDLDAATEAIVADPGVAEEFANMMAADTTEFDAAVMVIEQYSLSTCDIDLTDGAQP